MRGGVRGADAVSLRHLRGRRRGRAAHPPRGRDPRERPEPHRSGRRVRLLLCARGVRAVRRRLRDGHAQLQPRDRLHRLRHQRPPLLRAPLRRRRPRRVPTAPGTGGRARAGWPAWWWRSVARRRSSWPGRWSAPASPSSAPAPIRSTWPKTATGSTSCAPASVSRSPPAAPPPPPRRPRPSPPTSGSRCWCGRRTCSVAAPCRSSTTTTASWRPWRSWRPPAASGVRAGSRRNGRCWSTASSRMRSRSTSTPSATRPATS